MKEPFRKVLQPRLLSPELLKPQPQPARTLVRPLKRTPFEAAHKGSPKRKPYSGLPKGVLKGLLEGTMTITTLPPKPETKP